MSNILIVPNSGSIYFSTGLVGSSTIPNLSSGVAFQFDNSAGVNITSYATGVSANDRFSVDGYNGRLFNVSDNLTGVIFSVNDAAGLPIIEVDSSTVDRITMGTYASNTFVINDNRVGIGTGVPAAKLDIFDNVLAGSAGLSGSILNLNQTWNTTGTPTAIKLNVTDTASSVSGKLLDLQVSGVSKVTVDKGGVAMFLKAIAYDPASTQSSNVNGFQLSSPQFAGIHGLFSRYNSSSEGWVLKSNGAGQIAGTINWEGPFVNQHIGFAAGATQAVNPSTFLWGTPSNTLEQRNGVNPQKFTLYNTYTSSTNFERLNLRWDTNVVKIGTEKGSAGGVARDLVFETDGTERARITASGIFSVSGVSLGRGGGNMETNTAVGFNALSSNTSASVNTAVGYEALFSNISGNNNIALGSFASRANSLGSRNVAIGSYSLYYNSNTSNCVAVGASSLALNSSGNNNVAIGSYAGAKNRAGIFIYNLSDSTFIGTETKAYSESNTNSIVIGYNADGMGSNTAVLGNNNITDTYLKGAAQIHRLNADLVNYERIIMRWNGTTGTLGTSQLGTGIARDLAFETSGTPRMTIAASGDISFSNPTQVRTALGFVQLTPSAYADLVASGIANPDTIYIVQE